MSFCDPPEEKCKKGHQRRLQARKKRRSRKKLQEQEIRRKEIESLREIKKMWEGQEKLTEAEKEELEYWRTLF